MSKSLPSLPVLFVRHPIFMTKHTARHLKILAETLYYHFLREFKLRYYSEAKDSQMTVKELFLAADRKKVWKLLETRVDNPGDYIDGFTAALSINPTTFPEEWMFYHKEVEQVNGEWTSKDKYYVEIDEYLSVDAWCGPDAGTSIGSFSWPYYLGLKVTKMPKNLSIEKAVVELLWEKGGYDMPWDDGAFALMLGSRIKKPTKRDIKKARKVAAKTELERRKTIDINDDNLPVLKV